jgi:hypothetical protein
LGSRVGLSVLAALGGRSPDSPIGRTPARSVETRPVLCLVHVRIDGVAVVHVGETDPVAFSLLFVAGLVATVATCVGLDRLLALFQAGAAAVGHMLSRA